MSRARLSIVQLNDFAGDKVLANERASQILAEFDPVPVVEWLTHAGHLVTDDCEFATEFAQLLNEFGLQVDRLSFGIPILHPQIAGHFFTWEPDTGTTVRAIPTSQETLLRMENSPLRDAYREGKNTCYRIPPERIPGEFAIYDDLRQEGFTHHSTFAIKFSDGQFKSVTIATKKEGGFNSSELADFRALVTQLAPLLEIRSLKLMSRSLLTVYIGASAGSRVLNGEVNRGDGEVIEAVIWFSDLRNSTQLSSQLSGPEMISHLNEFFSVATNAIEAQGGEVLKFIGDAVLAIFPCENINQVGCSAAHHAELAASEVDEKIRAYNAEAMKEGRLPIMFGTALHIGEVFYGNIGADSRLDFTVIGPAVNLASRIESATKETQKPLLVSKDFAQVSKSKFDQIGTFRFNGVDGWTGVFAPTEILSEPKPVLEGALSV